MLEFGQTAAQAFLLGWQNVLTSILAQIGNGMAKVLKMLVSRIFCGSGYWDVR